MVPNQWCAEQRFRKGLALVSRLWWEPATRALYEHLVIRRVDQITALARTLRADDAGFNFGALVRRITLHECVVVLPDCNIVGEDVRTIFKRCIALEELSLRRHPDGVDVTVDSDDRIHPPEACINPIWIFPQIIVPVLQSHAPTRLRKLDLVSFACDHQNPSLEAALYDLIAASPHLTSLAVQNLEAPSPELSILSCLEDFSLYIPYNSPNSPLTHDIWKWTLPNLRTLTVLDCYLLPVPVLERLGRTLAYLHLYNTTYCEDPALAQLPALCPALEHLVLHPAEPLLEWHPALIIELELEAAGAHNPAQQFARLRFLDVWITGTADTQQWTAERAAALRERARASFAPALEGVRALLACLPGLPPDLPRMCHPSAMAAAGEDGSRLVCVRDIWVVQTAWCVRPLADWWLDEDMWLEDESGDYVYESESESDGEDEGESEEWDSEISGDEDGGDDVGTDAHGGQA